MALMPAWIETALTHQPHIASCSESPGFNAGRGLERNDDAMESDRHGASTDWEREMEWAKQAFESLDLGDARLNRRAVRLAERLSYQPCASIPR